MHVLTRMIDSLPMNQGTALPVLALLSPSLLPFKFCQVNFLLMLLSDLPGSLIGVSRFVA